jgi:hypothetical protein
MAFNVFLSYGLSTAEGMMAWRLQTLAVAYGIEMVVPRRGDLTPADITRANQAIDRADCVLAILTTAADQMAERELQYAAARKKLVIPIISPELDGHPLLTQFNPVFRFSPGDNPGAVETDVMNFLKGQQLSKEKQQALGGLIALGLGMIVLVSLNQE